MQFYPCPSCGKPIGAYDMHCDSCGWDAGDGPEYSYYEEEEPIYKKTKEAEKTQPKSFKGWWRKIKRKIKR